MITSIILAVACLIVGCVIGYAIFRYVIKAKYNTTIAQAELEAKTLKEKKLLEVKEEFVDRKEKFDKEMQQRNQNMLQAENRLKQREISINQRQEMANRRKMELDTLQTNLEKQTLNLQRKEEEVAKLEAMEREKLETISGLSAEEAKERLIVSLKDEARTSAQSYINEIMDEAKMTANKEAKKIVIQTIQRVATETAVENSVTVFHIDNDEVKGRIIGREGRNIRALEAATGVEIVVDDTPRGHRHLSFRPRKTRNLPPGTPSAYLRRPHPPRTHRRSGGQGKEAS